MDFIAGVTGAIIAGGPGAVFWMSLIAFVGGASAFVESTLAQIYKKRVKMVLTVVRHNTSSKHLKPLPLAKYATASADDSHPVKQGLVQMLSVFIDTLVCNYYAEMNIRLVQVLHGIQQTF